MRFELPRRKMGYFDGLTDASFKVDSLGRRVFYP